MAEAQVANGSARITRRAVFYFHGYDKRSARFARLVQQREARVYAKRHGVAIKIGPSQPATGGTCWSLSRGETETRFTFLDWSDVIAARFARPVWRLLPEVAAVYAQAIWQGFGRKTRQQDWAIWLLQVLGSGQIMVPISALLFGVFVLGSLTGTLISLAVASLFVWWLHRNDQLIGSAYVAQIASASRAVVARDEPAIEARIAAFADALRAACADDWAEEIVLVGHSLGTGILFRVLADLGPLDDPRLRILTIGQSIPLISMQREATAIRTRLAAEQGRDRWVDVSARRDFLGFYAVDPSGGGARCVAADMIRAFDAEALRRMRFRGFATHFQYFAANLRRDAVWDWLDLLTGDAPALARFDRLIPKSGKGERRSLL